MVRQEGSVSQCLSQDLPPVSDHSEFLITAESSPRLIVVVTIVDFTVGARSIRPHRASEDRDGSG